jgi:hypothetical protein
MQPVALDRTGEEGLHLVVDPAAQSADMLLEMPVMPMAPLERALLSLITPRSKAHLRYRVVSRQG